MPADARALLREERETLLRRRSRWRLADGNRDRETRAHLAEAANTLDEALKAPLQPAGCLSDGAGRLDCPRRAGMTAA